MTVICDEDELNYLMPDSKCLLCGDPVEPPCIEWFARGLDAPRGRRIIFICSDCGIKNKDGLMLDLIGLGRAARRQEKRLQKVLDD